MLVMMGAVVFQGGIVMPVLLVASRLPKVSAIVPLPVAEYVTFTPIAPAEVMSDTVRTTLVLSVVEAAVEVTAYVVLPPVFVTVKPPLLDFSIVETLASLLKVTVICVSEL